MSTVENVDEKQLLEFSLPITRQSQRGWSWLFVHRFLSPVYLVNPSLYSLTPTKRVQAATAMTGNKVSFSFPANKKGQLVACLMQIITTATVGNRVLEFALQDDGAADVYVSSLLGNIAASTTQKFQLGNNASFNPTSTQIGQMIWAPLKAPMEWYRAWGLRVTDKAAIDVLDTIQFLAIWSYEALHE